MSYVDAYKYKQEQIDEAGWNTPLVDSLNFEGFKCGCFYFSKLLIF